MYLAGRESARMVLAGVALFTSRCAPITQLRAIDLLLLNLFFLLAVDR